MAGTFNCPNCGAPLDYKGSDPIIRCPYCNGSVIVPDNLRSKPAFSSEPHSYTLSGIGDLGGLINQARRLKEVKDLAQTGNFEEAVQLYTEITNASPDAARSSVEALARGLPVTISAHNTSQVTVSDQVQSETISKTRPKSKNTSRWIGCSLGCLITGLVMLVLASILIPTLGSLAGVVVGLHPEIVLTAVPNIPAISTTISIPNTPVAESRFAIQEFSFGGEGTGPGLFGDVRAIAVDPGSGNIYAANYDDGRVQAFDPQGKFITQWIVQGKNPYIQSMAAGRDGNIYITVFGKILVYNSQGKLQNTISPPDLTDNYEYITVLADGSLMVVSRGENIVHLTPDGQTLDRFDAAVSTISGDPELLSKIAVDGLGNIFILGTFNNAVFVFNSEGKFLNRFGSKGEEPGQLSAASAIAVDGKGRIFISDSKGVQVFGNDGRYINVLKVKYYAFGLAFDGQGKLHITTNQKKVERYTIHP
ncbi:MAG: 6-bladed beta-propeller [Chloroflexi bacterium]|nr:6-bladed beta-propeller [Chloroflexota bacterium]